MTDNDSRAAAILDMVKADIRDKMYDELIVQTYGWKQRRTAFREILKIIHEAEEFEK